MLLGDCQDVVRQRQHDFDIGTHLSRIFFCVTSILICFRIGDPDESLFVCVLIIQKLEEHLIVRFFYLWDTHWGWDGGLPGLALM